LFGLREGVLDRQYTDLLAVGADQADLLRRDLVVDPAVVAAAPAFRSR